MATVDFYVDDYLEEASAQSLKRELDRRIAIGEKVETDPEEPEPWSRIGLACDIREAFYRRDASRLEMLLRLLETKEPLHG